MKRQTLVLVAIAVFAGCSSGTDGNQGDLTVNLGALPAAISSNADSAFVRVRSNALGVNEVRRIGLPGTSSVTLTVGAGTDYQVSVATLVTGPTTKFAIGGGVVEDVTVEAGGTMATTVPIVVWTADVYEVPDTFRVGGISTVRVALGGGGIRAVTDFQSIGMNLFLAPPPTIDDYSTGTVIDRFFHQQTTSDSLLFRPTAPATIAPTELYMHLRWSASTTAMNWTTGFPFDVALPSMTLGDTLWWRPLVP